MINVLLDTKLLSHGRATIVETMDMITRVVERTKDQFPFDGNIRVIACTDIGKSQHRLNLLPSYKSGRSYGCPEEYKQFKHNYIEGAIPLLKLLGVIVIDIAELEADDQASIISNILLASDTKVLVTEDRDWMQIVLSVLNTFLLSPKTFRMWDRKYIKENFGFDNKAQYLFTKVARGDTGDSIKPAATLCGDKCFEPFIDTVYSDKRCLEGTLKSQLDFLKRSYLAFLQGKPKHKVHPKYLGIVNSISEAIDLNILLGETMVDFKYLTESQEREFLDSLHCSTKLVPIEEINKFIQGIHPNEENPFGGKLTMPLETYSKFKDFYQAQAPIILKEF